MFYISDKDISVSLRGWPKTGEIRVFMEPAAVRQGNKGGFFISKPTADTYRQGYLYLSKIDNQVIGFENLSVIDKYTFASLKEQAKKNFVAAKDNWGAADKTDLSLLGLATPLPPPPPPPSTDEGPGVWAPIPSQGGVQPWQSTVAAIAADKIRLAWNTWKQVAATRYVIERSNDGKSGWSEVARVSPDQSLTDPNQGTCVYEHKVEPNSTHHYRISREEFFNQEGGDPLRADMGYATTPVKGPWTPDGLMVSEYSDSSIMVSWMPLRDVAAYEIERSKDGQTWTQAYSGTKIVTVDRGLASDTKYSYRIRAKIGEAYSKWSPAISTKTHVKTDERHLLRGDDIKHIGSYWLPYSGENDGQRINYSSTSITHKGGNRFFSLFSGHASPEYKCHLFEFEAPDTLSTVEPFPTAKFVKYWENPYENHLLDYDGYNPPTRLAVSKPTAGHIELYGLDFDKATGKIWWNGGEYYNVSHQPNPTLGYAQLDLDKGVIASIHGPWGLDYNGVGHPTELKTKGGSIRLPQWFADKVMGANGKSVRGIGFGGGWSGVAWCSGGPALYAVLESELRDDKASLVDDVYERFDSNQQYRLAPQIPATCLSAFDYDAKLATCPPGYRTVLYNSPQPNPEGYGYWQWMGYLGHAGVWIDNDEGTRKIHGLLMAGTFGQGSINYKATNAIYGYSIGGTCSDGGGFSCFTVLDPVDLEKVATGQAPPESVKMNPRPWWPMETPYADQRKPPYIGDYGGWGNGVQGVTFNPSANELHVVRYIQNGYGSKIVDVYKVA